MNDAVSSSSSSAKHLSAEERRSMPASGAERVESKLPLRVAVSPGNVSWGGARWMLVDKLAAIAWWKYDRKPVAPHLPCIWVLLAICGKIG